MDEGILFNIQKFSIHDGPGIRTTVFFKGCPLKCHWCSNPESQSYQTQILYNHKECQHCNICVDVCPHKAITAKEQYIYIDEKTCHGCLQCIEHCPAHALTYEGESKKVQDIVDICLQDIDFYEESGGGVTISGGEGMSQPIFLEHLMSALKQHHLHVAIETTGYIQEKQFQRLAPLFDLLLFDIKHYNSQQHYEGTCVHNELILANLKWAHQQGLTILPRIPVIPDFNNSLEDAHGFASLLRTLGITRVQLLPFHQFGEKKYNLLNKEYPYKNAKALYPEDLISYQKVFLDQGIDCFF